MTEQREVVVVRWPGPSSSSDEGPAGLLSAYHLRTEAEKGQAVADVDGLPDRYRAEVSDPRTAFADDVVLVALSGDTAVGCLVVSTPAVGQSEIKRL
ncbi:MAG: hypothetical protein ABIQ18_19630, partial [Umezawaea sp.]